MYNILIFSKDRSCQLDLLLRSIKKFFVGWDKHVFNILYTYSSDFYRQGYDRVISAHTEFNYVKESNFKEDVIKQVSRSNPYTLFGVDDDVFKETFDPECKEVKLLDTEEQLACLSLRMHPNISYCYTEDKQTPPPAFLKTDPYIWEWKGLPGDWGYTQSVDFSVFRTSDIVDKCRILPYNNPNTLEGYLAAIPIYRHWMACFGKSKIMNIPVNKVQTVNGNRFGTISAELLNATYINGHVISLQNIEGFNNIAAHQEIALNLVRG